MKAKLIIVGADIKPGEYKLKLPAVLGRGKDATLKLVHSLVSRQHCEIFETEGQLMVRDLGSLNGTYVAGQRIAEAVPLPPGELLTVGSVTFRAEYGEDVFLMPPPADGVFKSKETQEVQRTSRETVDTGDKDQFWVDPNEAPAVSAEENAAGEVAEDEFFDFLSDSPDAAPPADDSRGDTRPSPAPKNRGSKAPDDTHADGESVNDRDAKPANKKTGTKSMKRPTIEKPKPNNPRADDEDSFTPPDPSQQHPGNDPSDDDNWDAFLDGLQ